MSLKRTFSNHEGMSMRNLFVIPVSLCLILVMLGGCSKEHSPQPSNAHPENWSMASGLEGHGTKVLTSGKASCATCHGSDYKGGESGVSCYQCHPFYPHMGDWNKKGAAEFHGLAADADSLDAQCAVCHGENLEGQGDIPGCNKCHSLYPHEQGWMSKNTASFHGAFLKSVNWAVSSCTGCHGENLQGQGSSPACRTCHALYPHITGWNNQGNASFHGTYIKGQNWNLSSCTGCHGADFRGGIGGKDARSTRPTNHPPPQGWENNANANYHGAYLATLDWNLATCKPCHGDHFQGDGKAACNSCHKSFPHMDGWMNQVADEFHGAYLRTSGYRVSECSVCHGSDFNGGVKKDPCYQCHGSYPHATNWNVPTDGKSHIAYLRGHRFNLAECQSCHGADYHGGATGANCLSCHKAPGGVESCNLCHGSTVNNAPPRDTQGNTAQSVMSVGRHQLHVAERGYDCRLCHEVPATFAAAGHVYQDATVGQGDVISFWSWDHTTGTCVTACHNDPNKKYIWNQ
jgi:hypothetical protein